MDGENKPPIRESLLKAEKRILYEIKSIEAEYDLVFDGISWTVNSRKPFNDDQLKDIKLKFVTKST